MKSSAFLLLFCFAASALAETADEAWANIGTLRKGPGMPSNDAPEQVVSMARTHLIKQEKALESFIAKYPSDPRRHEAVIELSGVNATLATSLSDRNRMDKAIRDLAAVERDKDAPSKTRADAAFQRITTTMQTVVAAGQSRSGELSGARNLIYDAAGNFATRYPEDKRSARLLAEAATLFDDLPDRKRKILEQASLLARDEGTKHRVADDLKRLGLLGKTGNMSFDTIQGEKFSLADQRGKVVRFHLEHTQISFFGSLEVSFFECGYAIHTHLFHRCRAHGRFGVGRNVQGNLRWGWRLDAAHFAARAAAHGRRGAGGCICLLGAGHRRKENERRKA